MNTVLAENMRLQNEISNRDQVIVKQGLAISDLQRTVEILTKALSDIKKGLYGRKSEKIHDTSKQLKLIEKITHEVEVEPEAKIEVPAHTRTKAKRGKSLEDLPIVEDTIAAPKSKCECCGEDLVEIGREESKTLEYEPSKLFVKKTIRIKAACKCCKKAEISIAQSDSLIPGSFASSSIVSNILVSKYCDHIPLHRQEKVFERLGYELPRKLMCEWVQYVAEKYLSRIAQAIKTELLNSPYLHGDETTLEVLDKEDKNNIHRGYIWSMLGPPGVYFEYSSSRSQESARSIFGEYKGYLQTDLYAGYNKLPCKRLACIAHIRRKFINAPDCKEKTQVLSLIASLYHSEGKAKTPEELQKTREKISKKLLLDLFKVLQNIQSIYTPESDIVKGATYALKQWDDVLRIIENPAFALDNNPIERQIRPIAIGRKNWLFAGSERGAENTAIIYTILNSCKIAKVNPTLYLKDIFSKIQDYPVNKISDLIPINWVAKKAA